MEPMEPATPPRRPDGAQRTGHARTAARRSPVDRQRIHGSQMVPRGAATPPQRPDGVQESAYAITAARRDPGECPRPHGGQT